MTLASVAVIVFFRIHGHDRRRWHTVVAPSLAALGTVLVLVAANFTVLVPEPRAAWIVALPVVASFVVGVVLALRLRRVAPALYSALSDTQTH